MQLLCVSNYWMIFPDTAHMKEEPKEEPIMDSKGKPDMESMVMEESIETEDELSRDEVVSCICMLNEENGLMIQVNQYPLGACQAKCILSYAGLSIRGGIRYF